jgi:hypothetical protein
MVTTRSSETKDNVSNDDASNNDNNNNNNNLDINEAARDNNNNTTATTINTETITTRTTTTTETIADEALKNSNELYIRSHQVMGTDDQVTSVIDNLTHNLSGENLNSRLSPLGNLNVTDNLTDRDNLQSTVHNPSGENLNSRLSPLPKLNVTDNLIDRDNLQSTVNNPSGEKVLSETKAFLTDTPNDGENLKSKVSPALTSTNTTVHIADPEQSIVDTAHKSSKCSSTSQNQISGDQQVTTEISTPATSTTKQVSAENVENPSSLATSTKPKSKQKKQSPQKSIKVSIPTELSNPNKAFFRSLITDYSLPMNLLQIVLFLQSTDNTVICQPQVNYRPLSISNIKTKNFIENMEGTTGDLNEEMHVILYEVTDTEIPGRTVPIFSVYTTDEKSITGKQETLIYAQHPTVVELYKLAKIIQPDKQWKLDTPVNRYASTDEIEKVFCADRVKELYTETTYFYHQSNVGLARKQRKPNNTAQIQAAFATAKSSFQKTHRIRFAIIGGLHRVALAAHMFGNYVLDNKRPTKAPSNTYNFNGKSVLNSVLAVHLCIPHNKKLDETFVSHSREYSCIVQNRKSESFGPTIKSEMYLLLTDKSKPETNFKRYINSTFWTDAQVSHST